MSKGASLLPSGITKVSGHFKPGEAIQISCSDEVIAKGLALYSADDLNAIKGQKSDKIESILGYTYGEAVVHRDDMVLV